VSGEEGAIAETHVTSRLKLLVSLRPELVSVVSIETVYEPMSLGALVKI
jgi:hypothetical protein